MASPPTLGNTLSTEEIVHVIADGHEPSVYHWLYVKGGYVVKFNVQTGTIASCVKLPPMSAIAESADHPEQKSAGPYAAN